MKKLVDKNKIWLYLFLGVAYFILGFITTAGKHPDKIPESLMNNFWGGIYLTTLNFILFEYIVPFILKKRRFLISNILIGIFFIWICAMLYSFGSYLWRELGIQLHVFTALTTFPSPDHLLENQMAYSMGSVFLFGIIRHIYNYIRLKQATQKLRIEKQEAELNYLKSQTHPHFLFNTLNNIYALARDKSDLAPESIMRLSKILRFMLYETNGSYITIEQELKIIDDYISLEKLRYDDSLRINFNTNIEDVKQALPPLLLIPLVENAFKHGVSETRSHPFVDVHLSVKNRQLLFIVKNSTEHLSKDRTVKENIGLSNLRRQLELLYADYNLSVEQGNSVFTSTLKINLASHV